MSRTVLVPVDGSPLSSDALRLALREFPDAEITAYHVIDLFQPDYPTADPGSTYEPMIGTDEWDRFVADVRDALEADVSEIASDYDRSVGIEFDVGDPARLVLEYVDDEGVDRIVVGAHGRANANRPLFGSLAETVVRRAPVPVTVVR